MAYSLEDLLLLLRPLDPLKVDVLRRNHRRVEHGLLTVGLKLHCLKKDGLAKLVEELGGPNLVHSNRFYKHAQAFDTLVLPPVGSARWAILLLECLSLYLGENVFNNKDFQIQVCSPSRLDPYYANIFATTFYLGSDVLRRYTQADLATTFSVDKITSEGKHRGKRLVLYDGKGFLERGFDWWDLQGDRLAICPELPFVYERTDVLTCRTKVDIENVNLVATLLVHYQHLAYWEHLGHRFVEEFEQLLDRHLLGGILRTSWVHPADGSKVDDGPFFSALNELMGYAFSELERLRKEQQRFWRKPPSATGILIEARALLRKYRDLLLAESEQVVKGAQT